MWLNHKDVELVMLLCEQFFKLYGRLSPRVRKLYFRAINSLYYER